MSARVLQFCKVGGGTPQPGVGTSFGTILCAANHVCDVHQCTGGCAKSKVGSASQVLAEVGRSD